MNFNEVAIKHAKELDHLREVNAGLLAALEGILSILQQSNGGKGPTGALTTHLLLIARAAIAKAKGDA